MGINVSDFWERFDLIRKTKGMTQDELSRALNLPIGKFRECKSSGRVLQINDLVSIAEYFNTSLDWLVLGIESRSNKTTDLVNAYLNTDIETRFVIDKLLGLSKH